MALSGLKRIPERVCDRRGILAVKVMQVEDPGIIMGHVREELWVIKTVV
tara:strand:- start:301 stop:447 length:147 start_codon:yes stop_codon:yes gene_type:complete